MFSLILYEPEIPPNTGNVIRLCANTGVALHLIEPLGFDLEEKKLRRAGLDYREFASVQTHSSLSDCLDQLRQPRVFALSTRVVPRGTMPRIFAKAMPSCSARKREACRRRFSMRCRPNNACDCRCDSDNRSLNLSNTAAVIVYEHGGNKGLTAGLSWVRYCCSA